MENNIIEIDISENKPRGRGRPRVYDTPAKERNKETMRELRESGYFKKYYAEYNKPIECPICSTKTTTTCLKQHQKTKLCRKIKQLKQMKEEKDVKNEVIEYSRIINLSDSDY